ncbi:hypothetical protein JNW90_23650 [Micromonospora sp. STR1s_5]|nr:hypothetical protein [Micromonospora sp. STR1s_5]
MPNAPVPAAAPGLPNHRRAISRQVVAKSRPEIVFADFASIPDVYAMHLKGTCLEPQLMDGDEVVFTSAEPPKPGEFAIFILRPELVSPGGSQSMIKRLVLAPPPHVTFPWREHPKSEVHAVVVAEQLNPARQFWIRCDRLLAIHRFVRVQNRQVRT